ncbi:MAG: DNA repair protein RecN [Eggerthellaceae bacterium]
MLDEIHLHDVALIHDAEMTFSNGLTVVTGESGSGKTALLNGIKLLIGERGEADVVREGADKLTVEGRFFYQASPNQEGGHDSTPADEAAAGADGLVVNRTVSAEGRSRVRMAGSLASVRDLAQGPGSRVDLCGQHEHQRLLKPSEQASMLDAWIGREAVDAKVSFRTAFAAVRDAQSNLEHIRQLGASDAKRVDDARFVLRSIDAVGPEPGEYEELLARAQRAEHAEAIAQALNTASGALSDENGALDQVALAAENLEGIAGFDERYANCARALREAGFVLEDAARDLSSLRADDDSFDMQMLEQLQERIAAFQGLCRNWGPTMDEVFSARKEAAEILNAIDSLDEELAQARKQLSDAEEDLHRASERLLEVRSQAAPVFSNAVGAVLSELEMGGAEFSCAVNPLPRDQWTSAGSSQVEFLFRPAAGMQQRSLSRIASGGELSRVTLAIKAVLGEADGVETLIFDEVDAGVGGKAARAVAQVLKRLSNTHQVICVTHLAQIAVMGDAHYCVQKVEGSATGVPQTTVSLLEGDDRIDEISRMLSGQVDKTSRAHARELLQQAQLSER